MAGANLGDTLEQITDRLERKLQETPNLDYLKTTRPRPGHDLRLPEGLNPRGPGAGIWYQVRKKVGDIRNTLPPGIVEPGFNDEFAIPTA